MRQISVLWILPLTLLAPRLPAIAADAIDIRPPKSFVELTACRAERDPSRRLACYDAQVRELVEAESSHDIVVIDREQMREARKTLFGLSLPRIAIFDGRAKTGEVEEIQQVEGSVSTARTDHDGRWLFLLEDGARWRQIDSYPLALPPKHGDKVVIKRASLGSFMLRLNGMTGIRVRRVN